MRYGVTIVPTDTSIRMADFARAVQERGLDGLWVPDHTHVPVRRASPYPLGGDLPDRYRRNLEPLVALGIAAAATSTIRLGTGVLLAALRDPIVTAKALATLDQQSGGRLAVGVGFGWNTEEIAGHGVDPRTRRGRTREHVLAMRALWEHDVAAFEGGHVRFPESWSWPKPLRRPLPVLIGGAPTELVFSHVVEYAQGWIAVGGHGLADAVARLRAQANAAARPADELEIVTFTGAEPDHAKIDALARAGATEIAFEVPPASSTEVLGCLDHLAGFVGTRRTSRG